MIRVKEQVSSNTVRLGLGNSDSSAMHGQLLQCRLDWQKFVWSPQMLMTSSLI